MATCTFLLLRHGSNTTILGSSKPAELAIDDPLSALGDVGQSGQPVEEGDHSHSSFEHGRLMPSAIWIPGVKHNMDNTCKDIWESVQGQADYSKNLRALESLLAPVPTRDKIIEVFFADPLDELDAQTASKLRVWNCTLKSLRWHSVVDFTQALLGIKEGLRRRWHLGRFVKSLPRDSQHSPTEGRGPQGCATYNHIDVVIRSEFFWSYAAMILEVSSAANTLSSWAEGCWFHGSGCGSNSCPYKGCRGAELAGGAHQWLLNDLKSKPSAGIVRICCGVNSKETQHLTNDWHSALTRLSLEFSVSWN